MKVIPKPIETAKQVFMDCISTVAEIPLKRRLAWCQDEIEAAEIDFDIKFRSYQIYQMPQNLIILGKIGKKEMKSVYDYRMVTPGMPGNKHYNKIKSSAPFGKCPLCSVRIVDTLDHYLPKSKYPSLAVTPINLIPACTPCNKGKHIDVPSNDREQTLHPYYDNVENVSWIKGRVLQTNPISFEYYVDCPVEWDQILKDRVKNHFDSFGINEIFSAHANDELRGARLQHINLHNDNPNLLIDHLQEAFQSRLVLGINSWQAILYSTLLNDNWFVNGGVLT